jgi:hypothetical protein
MMKKIKTILKDPDSKFWYWISIPVATTSIFAIATNNNVWWYFPVVWVIGFTANFINEWRKS